jgi:hypothetical protein
MRSSNKKRYALIRGCDRLSCHTRSFEPLAFGFSEFSFLPSFAVPYEPIQVKWSGERCGVCHSEEDFEDDQLITCDRCSLFFWRLLF